VHTVDEIARAHIMANFYAMNFYEFLFYTLVLLDILPLIIAGSEHCERTRVSAGLVPLTLKFQFSTHINNFEV